jgi:hypothetical protein
MWLVKLLFIAVVVVWVAIVAIAYLGTVVLAVLVAWDQVVSLIKRDAEKHKREDEIKALERLYKK